MAIRNIRKDKDPILRKKSKEVTEITPKIHQLIEDMFDTMYEAEGVGLAAVQIGILKRIVVIDIGEEPIALINPRVIEARGEKIEPEGCLSFPGQEGYVPRPAYVKVAALNEQGEEMILEGRDLLAKAFCHEIDHLDGILYLDKVVAPPADVLEGVK